MRRYIVTRRAPGILEAAGFATLENAITYMHVSSRKGYRITFKSVWVKLG